MGDIFVEDQMFKRYLCISFDVASCSSRKENKLNLLDFTNDGYSTSE